MGSDIFYRGNIASQVVFLGQPGGLRACYGGLVFSYRGEIASKVVFQGQPGGLRACYMGILLAVWVRGPAKWWHRANQEA